MDVNKILEMLEREEKVPVVSKRKMVAKESLVRASGGDLDAINNLLEEDIMLDDQYASSRTKREKPVVESIKRPLEKENSRFSMRKEKRNKSSIECDSTSIGVNNPIPSPVRKRKANESDEDREKNCKLRKSRPIQEACAVENDKEFSEKVCSRRLQKPRKAVEDDENSNTVFIDLSAPSENIPLEEGEEFTFAGDVPCCSPEDFKRLFNRDSMDGFEVKKINGREMVVIPKGQKGKLVSKKGPKDKPVLLLDDKAKIEGKGGEFYIIKNSSKDKSSIEEVVEVTQSESVFPEEVDFDEEAFAELIDSNPEDILVSYVQEDENEPEHFEVRFKKGDQEVLLKLKSDGTTEEVVNARIIDPAEFSYTITQDDEGQYILLISPEEAEETGEERDVVKSENDTDPGDEEGSKDSDEFIQENGLKLDGEYQRIRGEKPDKNASKPVKESLSRKRRMKK